MGVMLGHSPVSVTRSNASPFPPRALQGWYFYREDVRERRFDEFGLPQDIHAPGSGHAVFPGAVLRVDDLF
jgi:hypothetical protein